MSQNSNSRATHSQPTAEEEGNTERRSINSIGNPRTRRSTPTVTRSTPSTIGPSQRHTMEQPVYRFANDPYLPHNHQVGRGVHYHFVNGQYISEEELMRRAANGEGSSQTVIGIPTDYATRAVPDEDRRIRELDAGLLHHTRVFEYHHQNILHTYDEVGLLWRHAAKEKEVREQMEKKMKHLEWALGFAILLLAMLFAYVLAV